MGVLDSVKGFFVVAADSATTVECGTCGNRFESHMAPDSVWLSCPECESGDVAPAEGR